MVGTDGAHLCTGQSVALWCPRPVCRLWSSAGTGRHRSPRLSRTPAPRWQRWREGSLEHMLSPLGPLKQCSLSLLTPCCKLVDSNYSCLHLWIQTTRVFTCGFKLLVSSLVDSNYSCLHLWIQTTRVFTCGFKLLVSSLVDSNYSCLHLWIQTTRVFTCGFKLLVSSLVDSNYSCLHTLPTLVLFFSSQSGEGHSQWAWPFTSMQEAPKLHTSSSHEAGASGPAEEDRSLCCCGSTVKQFRAVRRSCLMSSDCSSCATVWSYIKKIKLPANLMS